MPIEDVTNPGVVTVADQAFDGLPENIAASNGVEEPVSISPNNERGDDGDGTPVTVDQAVTVTPQTTSVNNRRGDSGGGPGAISVDQPVTITPSMTSQRSVPGAAFQPGNGQVINTTQNNVAGQIYGQGTPQNVFV
jgi:hypothetical protein